MNRLHFACELRLNRSDVFVIWYTNDRDGFIRHPDGRLINATSLANLTAVAISLGVALEPDSPARYDFDSLRNWCGRPMAETVECSDFLNAWNFFDDLAGLNENPNTHFAKLSRSAEQIYDKLFRGNNLPSITPSGEMFIPTWDVDEFHMIRQVLETGICMLEDELRA